MEKKVKIAVLGNMNNNHFSLMRYFRDMGYDAYLLLYSNDGTGDNAHFIPENDTWNIEKWKPYIIQTPIPNGSFKGIIKIFLNYRKFKKYLNGYDYIIGNGFAPALSFIFNLQLDLFLPYSYGIEFLRERYLKFGASIYLHRYLQKKGLKNSVKHIGTIDFTKDNLTSIYKLGIENKLLKLSIPMVYMEDFGNAEICDSLYDLVKKISGYKLKLLSHVSHVTYDLGWRLKRNDILIKGFADYLHRSLGKNAVLVLLDYGDNVAGSKQLIEELKIQDNVVWLPKMSRKELLYILQFVDVGGGELGGAYWGGTGWEFLAYGIPFFQNIGMTKEAFQEKTETPLPDIFNVKSSDEIANILLDIESGSIDIKSRSILLKKWFHTYNGMAEARKIISLIGHKE